MKRKLLDSRMMSVFGSEWTEWNVRPAVKVWREAGRNFGLVVEVEDEDGGLLPAHQFFNGMNCTQEACECALIFLAGGPSGRLAYDLGQ